MADFWDYLAGAGQRLGAGWDALTRDQQYSYLPPDPNAVPKPGQAIPPTVDPRSVAPVMGQQLAGGMVPTFLKPIPQDEWSDYNRQLSALPADYTGRLPPNPADSPLRTPLGAAAESAMLFPGGEGLAVKGLAGGAKLAAGILPRVLGAGAEDVAKAAAPSALRAWAEPLTHTPESLVQSGLMPVMAGDTRISSRFPTAMARTEDPMTQQLGIDLPAYMRKTPRGDDPFAQNMGLVATYPGFAKFAGQSPEDVFRGASDQMRGNMQFIRDNAPAPYLERSPLWYEGANQISSDLADRWGVPRQSASGALAALSPQKDWFQNVSNAERVGDILSSPTASMRMTSEMRDLHPTLQALNSPDNLDIFRAIQGKSLQQVLDDPVHAAMWIRLYDEAHNSPNYRAITPEGLFGAPVLTDKGVPANRAWNSGGEIAKAVRSLTSGGDMNVISPAMGNANKVRSFYNNIELPMDRLYGDVTADTHQVAAAQLRPLSGNSYPVAHNFGNSLSPQFQGADFPGHASSSSFSGIGGTYPLAVDAARQFATDNQMLPRAAQSQAWEAVRELFPDTFKTDKNVGVIDDIWRAHDRGEISLDAARKRILDYAAPSGIGLPSWAQSSAPVARATRASTYR